jgi:AcrR family transcriptional regulator
MSARRLQGETHHRRRLTRGEAKARTRERLLDSAARVFAQRGFGGASLEEIAESAGYSTGAVYANFENKEQLFMELVATRRSKTAARRVEAIARVFDEDVTPDEPLQALSQLFVQFADRDREMAPLQAEFWLYAVRNPAAMEVIAASLDEQVEALEPVVARALERAGVTPGASLHEVSMVVLALFQGLVRRRRLDPAAVPEDLPARALRWLFAGIRGEADGTGTPQQKKTVPRRPTPVEKRATTPEGRRSTSRDGSRSPKGTGTASGKRPPAREKRAGRSTFNSGS